MIHRISTVPQLCYTPHSGIMMQTNVKLSDLIKPLKRYHLYWIITTIPIRPTLPSN